MTSELSEKVKKALMEVYDPELPVNIVDLGLIYDVQVNEKGFAKILMTLTAPNCAAAGMLPQMVKGKARQVPGITGAEVELTWDPPWSKDKMSLTAKIALNMI